MKVIYNNSFGGFGFSKKDKKMICNLKGLDYETADDDMFNVRENPDLRIDKDAIYTIEKLGKTASSQSSELVIANIPDGWHFTIGDTDGYESLFFSKNEIYDYSLFKKYWCFFPQGIKDDVSYETFNKRTKK